MSSLLVRDTTTLTQDSDRRVVRGDVYVEDGRIVTLGGKHTGEAEHKVDGRNRLMLPGLVNTHSHVAMGLFRGYGDDLTLEKWLQERIWPAEAKLTEKTMAIGARLGVLEMITAGITSYLDMYFIEDATAEVTAEAGMRGHAGWGMVDLETPEGEPNPRLAEIEASIKRWKGHPLVSAHPAPHAVYTCHDETLRAAAELARKHQVPLHTHCAETRKEVYDVQRARGKRPLAVLDEVGFLGPGTVLAHCGWITKEEAQRIGATGSAVSHNPVSNMKLATGGHCPLPELFDAGVPVGLGTDGAASGNRVDLFEAMKTAALLLKHARWDATLLPAQRALDLATRDGARALGDQAKYGSLAEGGPADLILLDLGRPHMTPRHDLVSQVVYAATARDVTTTVVAGRPLLLEGQVLTMDAPRVMAEADEAARALVE